MIDVVHSRFNRLVLECKGNAGPLATRALKQIAAKISEKRHEAHADVISVCSKP